MSEISDSCVVKIPTESSASDILLMISLSPSAPVIEESTEGASLIEIRGMLSGIKLESLELAAPMLNCVPEGTAGFPSAVLILLVYQYGKIS